MGDSLEQRTFGLLRFGRALALAAALSFVPSFVSSSASAQSVKSGPYHELNIMASAVSDHKAEHKPKRKTVSNKFTWKPHPELIIHSDKVPITLSNGLVIDRRYEISETRMDSLSKWLFAQENGDWDIIPSHGYSILMDHTTRSHSFKDDITRLQSFGKIHFYNPRDAAWGDTVFSIVPLSYTANQTGTTLLNGSTHIARRAVGIENQSDEDALLTEGLPCLLPLQIEKHNKLKEYVTEKYSISPDSIFTHSDVAMSFEMKVLNRKVNADEHYPLPDEIIGSRYSRKTDGICFDRAAMGIPTFVDPDTNRLKVNQKEYGWRKERSYSINVEPLLKYLTAHMLELRITPSASESVTGPNSIVSLIRAP